MTSHSTTGGGSAARGSPEGIQRCPFCGSRVPLEMDPEAPELEGVPLDSLETLVRAEWRRRLGPDSYEREHTRALIRVLLVSALLPESPVVQVQVQELLWAEVAMLLALGFSRVAIQHELGELIMAVRAVLRESGAPWERVLHRTDAVHASIRRVLDWPGELTIPVDPEGEWLPQGMAPADS